MSPNLQKIRDRITGLQREINLAKNAGLPRDETIAALGTRLGSFVKKFDAVKADLASGIAQGNPDALTYSFPERMQGEIAIGCAIAAYGLDRLLSEAEAAAGEGCELRLTAAERAETLKKLWCDLYEQERLEELARGHEPRRSGCNAAAVLGVPLDVAEAHGLTGYREGR